MNLEEFTIEKLEEKLEQGETLDIKFDGGVFHMERNLPFLLVYRTRRKGEYDPVIVNLLKNEAAYFICAATEYNKYRAFLKKTVKKMSDDYGAFFLLEIWSGEETSFPQYNNAVFELLGPLEELPKIITPVKDYIENMKLAGLVPKVKLNESDTRCPKFSKPLLERKTLKQLECLLIGLKIEPFYMDSSNRRVFPLLERRLYSEFSEVFKKSVFDFVKIQTNQEIAGYQSLARRRLKPNVWEIDKQLVSIDEQVPFLMLVSPVNSQRAWKEFKKSGFKDCPSFHYRMMPVDPAALKRDLYNIKIEEIEDPTIHFLFREKRAEIDKMLTMLNERESNDFFYGSLQVFGSVSKKLLSSAKEILKKHPPCENIATNESEYYTVNEFKELAEKELKKLQVQCHEIKTQVEVKNTVDNMIVDKGVLNIPEKTKVHKPRAESLIQHEIGTHVLTYYNGQSQPLNLLSSGVPGYEELQEGIAVFAEYLTGGLSKKRMQKLAARVIAVDSMINHRNFVTTFELLTTKYNFKPKQAFFICVRVYRGGGLTKDAIYLRGLLKLLDYLKEGNPLQPLLIGKIRQNYIPVINELIARKILKPIKIKPSYLENEEALEKLSNVKNIHKITDLINSEI
ncbi:MAG TPA: tyrosine/phenylalanine carboxypeptidase domain-containing protein [Prolixibacteraceae bacterium]|nr:tyrosine/phenylalanine carboxypeptidase domain-containing protein [Prolixibacteraceae bacterium]